MESQPPDYYRTLQVDPEADPDVIKAAYKRLVQKYHPDVNQDPEAADKMAQIMEAWEVLSDPAARAEYDRTPRPSPTNTNDTAIPPRRLRRRIPLPPRNVLVGSAVGLGVLLLAWALWPSQDGDAEVAPTESSADTPSAPNDALVSTPERECYRGSKDREWIDAHQKDGGFEEVRQEWVETNTGRSRAWCFYR